MFAIATIRGHVCIRDLTDGFKQTTDLFRLGVKTQISHKEFHFHGTGAIKRSAALLTRTGFGNTNGPAVQFTPVQFLHGADGLGSSGVSDKSESTGAVRSPFHGHKGIGDGTLLFKDFTKAFSIGAVVNVSNVEFDGGVVSSAGRCGCRIGIGGGCIVVVHGGCGTVGGTGAGTITVLAHDDLFLVVSRRDGVD